MSMAPEADDEAPARTQRLLAHPLRLIHTVHGDALDSLSLFLLMRSTGGSVSALLVRRQARGLL